MSNEMNQPRVSGDAYEYCTEICPHCDMECDFHLTGDQMVATCPHCGRSIVVCDKCCMLHPDVSDRPCDNCMFCAVADFMNFLKGFDTADQFLASLNPPITDMTTGLPEGAEPTLGTYFNNTYGDSVIWDDKYWEARRMLAGCPLNENSSEAECREFVQRIIDKNNE